MIQWVQEQRWGTYINVYILNGGWGHSSGPRQIEFLVVGTRFVGPIDWTTLVAEAVRAPISQGLQTHFCKGCGQVSRVTFATQYLSLALQLLSSIRGTVLISQDGSMQSA